MLNVEVEKVTGDLKLILESEKSLVPYRKATLEIKMTNTLPQNLNPDAFCDFGETYKQIGMAVYQALNEHCRAVFEEQEKEKEKNV